MLITVSILSPAMDFGLSSETIRLVALRSRGSAAKSPR